jgi:hypothetical protein
MVDFLESVLAEGAIAIRGEDGLVTSLATAGCSFDNPIVISFFVSISLGQFRCSVKRLSIFSSALRIGGSMTFRVS